MGPPLHICNNRHFDSLSADSLHSILQEGRTPLKGVAHSRGSAWVHPYRQSKFLDRKLIFGYSIRDTDTELWLNLS
jgi:hypothetical protein